MSKINFKELLQQDINDIKGLIDYEKYGLPKELMQNQARAILLNIQEHFKIVLHN